jgi:hypothetical protein
MSPVRTTVTPFSALAVGILSGGILSGGILSGGIVSCAAPSAPRAAELPLIAAPHGVLEPSDAAEGDELGDGLAITPAGDWMFVGAPYHATTGAVYAFAATSTGWELRETIVPVDARESDRFGHAIATDGVRVAIASPGDDAVLYESAGAISVYRIEAGTLALEQRVENPAPATANEMFGYALAFVDGSTLVVGAPNARAFFSGAGAAYVLERSGTTWSVGPSLEPSTLSSNDSLGFAVAAGPDTIVVGAPYDDGIAEENTGAAFVFVRAGATWVEQARLRATTSRSWEHVGSSVAIDPSGERIALGAPGADDDEDLVRNRGVAYVFARSGTAWSEEARLHPVPMTDWTDSAGYGTAIALGGDLLVVGAPGAYRASLGRDPGFVYVYSRIGSEWAPELDLTGRLLTGEFGDELALAGGVLAVGAPGEDVGAAADRGAVYAYELLDPRPAGAACAAAIECESGFCTDGVCCDRACGGSAIDCEACSVAAGASEDGVCATARADAVCRAATGACDVAEDCDGVTTACPEDVHTPDATACDDGMACNGADACSGGACVPTATSLDCDDGDPCTADSCADPAGCAHAPIDGCAPCDDPSDCPARDCALASCTGGACAWSAPACDGGAVPGDGGVPAVDAGREPVVPSGGGCGCVTPGPRRDPIHPLASIALAATLLVLARRRTCRS